MADWLTTWSVWHWLVLGFVLLIAETLVPGVFLLWWGLAAIVAAGVMALVPSLSLTALAIFYAILAIILSLLWWKYQHSKDIIFLRKNFSGFLIDTLFCKDMCSILDNKSPAHYLCPYVKELCNDSFPIVAYTKDSF